MKILVLGDALIDRYSYVTSTRQSPEDASAKVWDVCEEQEAPGGCLNVAANLASITGDPVFFSAIVQHSTRNWLKTQYGLHEAPDLCATTARPLDKHRLIAVDSQQQICRIDNGKRFSRGAVEDFEAHFRCSTAPFDGYDAVVVSDYGKGTVTDLIIAKLKETTSLVLIDTKRPDLAVWRDIPQHIIKINMPEFCLATNTDQVKALIVTHGGTGAQLYRQGQHSVTIMSHTVNNADTIGAGDVYLAGLADALANQHLLLEDAMTWANTVARASVRKPGTSIVSIADIEQEIWRDHHRQARQDNGRRGFCQQRLGL